VVCCDGTLSPSCRCKGGGGPEPIVERGGAPDVLLVGDVSVKGYFRRDGTYVQPHRRPLPVHRKREERLPKTVAKTFHEHCQIHGSAQNLENEKTLRTETTGSQPQNR
jgi:hypothetical protein